MQDNPPSPADADLAAMAMFGKTVDELTETEFAALLKTPGGADLCRVETVTVTFDIDPEGNHE